LKPLSAPWRIVTLSIMSELRVGLIGGTGLGEALRAENGIRHDIDTPFGKPSDAIIETTWAGVSTLILSRHGPGHLLNPSQVPSRANLFALKKLGCTQILASGAVGSLRDEFKPRDLVIPDQIIDRTTDRISTFFERAAVHVEFAEPFCPVLRRMLMDAARQGQGARGERQAKEEAFSLAPGPSPLAPAVHSRGCYLCMEGPAFSTRAESLMHRLWGGDLIGMTAMPEAKLARESEIPYALVALVTDYDSWKPHAPQKDKDGKDERNIDPFTLLNEIIGNLKTATRSAIDLMRRTVELMGQRRAELDECPAQHALKLAIWSDKTKISNDERQRLAPLWMKYFED
jgi:5'-methylthioadenosine phosphorylase